MQKFSGFLAFVLVTIGCLVMLVSLQSANRQLTDRSDQEIRASKLYVSMEILPDHSLYPFLMVADRVRLELISPQAQAALRLEYAKRRLWYAEQLLAKGNVDLAYVTFSKAIHYLQQAGAPPQLVIEFLMHHQEKFRDEQRAALQLLIDSF